MIEEQSYKRTQRLYLSEQVQQEAREVLGSELAGPTLSLSQLFSGALEVLEGFCKMHATDVACMGSVILNTRHWEEFVCT